MSSIGGDGARTHAVPLPYRRIKRPTATVEAFPDGQATVQIWGVMSEADVAAWLGPLLQGIHHDATSRHLTELVLDLRGLEYANTALWKCVVVWLKTLREDTGSRYVLRIVSDPKHGWQEVGLAMLKVFGASRLVIDGKPVRG